MNERNMRIACLHTAASNIAIFDSAALHLPFETAILQHVVHAELLFDAEKQGGVTLEITDKTLSIIDNLTTQADVILVTCSTLGPVADHANTIFATPVLRSDRALAQQALQTGQTLTVLCTAPTTLNATAQLFRDVFSGSSIVPDIRLVQSAWDLFRSGKTSAYYQAIADAADTAHCEGSELVVLAQTSMTDAATHIHTGQPPLVAPVAALKQIMQLT